MGCDPLGMDPNRLLWLVQARCRDLKLTSTDIYAAYLEETPGEIDALVEVAVVRETRFFRDSAVFNAIRRNLVTLAVANMGPIRILSAPCGSRQEAYSVAALCQLVSVVPGRFTIDAFDISATSLATAGAGVYPAPAFGLVAPELQRACARREGDTYRIHPDLRERVRLERRNLASPGSLGVSQQYHLILCRNLFIYLAPEARAALAQSLSDVLLPNGRLFLGTADRVPEVTALFSPIGPAAAFEYVHRASSNAAKRSFDEPPSRPTFANYPSRNRKSSQLPQIRPPHTPATATEPDPNSYRRAVHQGEFHGRSGHLPSARHRGPLPPDYPGDRVSPMDRTDPIRSFDSRGHA
jgi:chemotaxis protein methyltransferase WspC